MPSIFIGPYEAGLEKDIEPFLLPQDAYTELDDAYIFRGKTQSKEGYAFLGRLNEVHASAAAGNVDAAGAFAAGTVPGAPISPGTLTLSVATAPATVFADNGNGTLTSTTVDVNFGFIDYETGVYRLNFDPATPGGEVVTATVYDTLPRHPVMGLATYDLDDINREDLIAFDTANSYLYNTGTSLFSELVTGSWGANPQFTSTDSDFVWWTNYYVDSNNNKLLWICNNIETTVALQDGIQYFNGTSWVTQAAEINAVPDFLRGALILIPYRNRLVALNTLERDSGAGTTNRRAQRARWSQNGTPLIVPAGGPAFNERSWREDVIGRGGFIDAPTSEAIVSAEFVKDTLIVFFERSTWELKYTGNELLPFIWQQINTELGAESTFSIIPFDDGVLAVGDKRIVSANSAGVQAIDQKIPDEVYAFHNDNLGHTRVHGKRDFFKQLALWTFPNAAENRTFPNRMLVFNYENNSFSFFNDSFTTLGTYQKISDYTWTNPPAPSWDQANVQWNSVSNQSFFPSVVAGNQVGFIEVLLNTTINEQSLDLVGANSITNATPAIFTVTNHNLEVGRFIRIDNTRAFPVSVAAESLGTAISGTATFSCAIANRGLVPATAVITLGAITFTDVGDGSFNSTTAGASGVINYDNGFITLTFTAIGANTAVTVNYDYNTINTRPFELVTSDANTFSLQPYQADVVAEAIGTTTANSTSFSDTLDNIPLVAGTVKIIMGTNTFRDNEDGTLDGGNGTSTIDYVTGEVVLNYLLLAGATAVTGSYSHLSDNENVLGFGGGANYDGTGEISVINNINIKSKRFSPFLDKASDFRLKFVDLLLARGRGSFEIDTFVDQTNSQEVNTLTVSTANEGESTFSSEKIWKKVYVNTTSNFIQLQMTRSKFQMSNPIDYRTNWVLNAMILDVEGAGRLK